MSFPIRRFITDPWCQQVPEVPQVLRRISMAAGENCAGLRREVGGPRRPLRHASQEACHRLETVVDGLDLRGVFAQQEAVVENREFDPNLLAYAGHRNGGDVDHWWIGGDLDHAFGTAPKSITLLVGAGILRNRRRPVARTDGAAIPLRPLASERPPRSMTERVQSVGFEPGGPVLGTWESLWLLAGSVAKLVRALPGDGPEVRLLFRIPVEEYWLPVLPALRYGLLSRDQCSIWFARTRRDRDLFQGRFMKLLGEMLGEHRDRVKVVVHDALHQVGERLEEAVNRGEEPTAADLAGRLRRRNDLWNFVLDPRNVRAVLSEFDAERRFVPEPAPCLDGAAGLVNAADVVDLLGYGSDGLAVVVDDATAARRMIGLADRFARRHPDGVARTMAIGPLGKIFGGGRGSHDPFSLFRGKSDHMVVLDPDDPTQGERVPSGDLFRELYSVR